MKSSKVAIINQTNRCAVPLDELKRYAAALQQQVNDHLAPAWNVRADISVPAPGDVIPRGTRPLKVVDSLPGQAGVHTRFRGRPSAQVVNDDQLSITLSHELLEMLVDPAGDFVKQAADIDPYSDGQPVNYLVEVCDPVAVYTYEIDGVKVSDFVLPSFYDPSAKGEVVDHAEFLAGPLTVPLGGYIAWLDPTDYRWHEQQPDGTFLIGTKPGRSRDDRAGALGRANPDRHNVSAIHRRWPRAVKHRPPPS